MKITATNVPMASSMLAIAFGSAVFCGSLAAQSPASNDDRQLIAELVMQVQELQDEVRNLRGQIEDMGYQVETVQERQRAQYLDLDQRINDLRAAGINGNSGVAAADPTTTPGANEPAAGGNSAQPDLPEVRAPIEADTAVTGLVTPAVASVNTEPTPLNEKEAYDSAFQALKDLRYAEAAEGFSDFLQAYPQSEYADNAQYWLGESYYVTGNYDIALESFEGLLTTYPDSAKAPDSLLKIGYTHYEMQSWDQARAALEQVKATYPDTTVARLAESRLRSMRLEGR